MFLRVVVYEERNVQLQAGTFETGFCLQDTSRIIARRRDFRDKAASLQQGGLGMCLFGENVLESFCTGKSLTEALAQPCQVHSFGLLV